MSVDIADDIQLSLGACEMYGIREEAAGLYFARPRYVDFGKRGFSKVPPYENLIRGGKRRTKAIRSWVEGSRVQADRADEPGPNFFVEIHHGPTILAHPDGSISITVHASSTEAAMGVVLAEPELRVVALSALVREGFEPSKPPERIDEMNGVVREVAGSEVSVSLFDGEEEFCVELPRKIFENGKVSLLEDEGFEFFVERYSNGSEKPVVRPLPRRELSPNEREQIVNEIDELLDGD